MAVGVPWRKLPDRELDKAAPSAMLNPHQCSLELHEKLNAFGTIRPKSF
jgi:hypothetical protein